MGAGEKYCLRLLSLRLVNYSLLKIDINLTKTNTKLPKDDNITS